MPQVFNRLYHKSSENLSDLPDDSVTLTVTSPPYWNAIDYESHADDPEADYRTREYGGAPPAYVEYLEWLEAIFDQVLQTTRPGGYAAVVVGTVLNDGRHYPLPMDLTTRLTHSGWEFHQDIVWNKVTGGVKRAGVYIQHPYPGYYRPNIMTEYILIFRKPGPMLYRQYSKEEKEAASGDINRLFTKELANNVWHIAPVPPRMLEHPCPFPEEIPWRLIQLYSYPDDVVLDPFAGSGQTVKVARHLGRRWVGYDVVEAYVEYALKRVEEPLAIRDLQLVAEFEKIPLQAKRDGPKRANARTRHGSGRTSS